MSVRDFALHLDGIRDNRRKLTKAELLDMMAAHDEAYINAAAERDMAEAYYSALQTHLRVVHGCGLAFGTIAEEPEQADGMTAAKARDDLERGTAHFDREYVEWRGTEVEVTG